LIRLVATLVSAILLSHPGMPKEEATRYAKVLNEVGKERDFDPLLAVAIIHFETRWRPGLVSEDGEDHGLGQVRARFIGACRSDEDPLGNPSEACKAVKASLLNGEHNIRVMGAIIEANRDLCKEKTGTAKAQQWLAGYEGLNFPEQHRWCRPNEKTWRVISYHQELLDKLLPRPAAPKGKGKSNGKGSGKSNGKAGPGQAAGAKSLRVASRAKAGAKAGAKR
jgi:hypothetical protein